MADRSSRVEDSSTNRFPRTANDFDLVGSHSARPPVTKLCEKFSAGENCVFSLAKMRLFYGGVNHGATGI